MRVRIDMKSILRQLIIIILVVGLIAVGVRAYVALTGSGDITVTEPLSFVGNSTFSVNLYPLEETTAQLTVANASSSDLSVDLTAVIVPDPGNKGLSVDIPNSIVVPANGQAVIDITISAGKSAVPDTYSVSIMIDR